MLLLLEQRGLGLLLLNSCRLLLWLLWELLADYVTLSRLLSLLNRKLLLLLLLLLLDLLLELLLLLLLLGNNSRLCLSSKALVSYLEWLLWKTIRASQTNVLVQFTLLFANVQSPLSVHVQQAQRVIVVADQNTAVQSATFLRDLWHRDDAQLGIREGKGDAPEVVDQRNHAGQA